MIKISKIGILIFIFNCAYQGSPGGGPVDNEGPILIDTYPPDQSFLDDSDRIIIQFNEYIDPKSIIHSISVSPETNIDYEVKGKKIIIKPLDNWSVNQPTEINLNRNITDFQSNVINESIQLIYNINDNNYCSISGDLKNSTRNKLYNLFIYSWPLDISEGPVKKINTNDEGHFNIKYLKHGRYIIVASEGTSNINNYRNGMTPVKYIDLNSQNCDENTSIYIDNPIDKIKISRVETINPQLLNIFYDDDTKEPYTFNANVGDSIYINIKKKNRLFEYDIDPYLYIVQEKIDSIGPYITLIDNLDSILVINFSEPINQNNLLIEGEQADDWFKLKYNIISSMAIYIDDYKFSKIKFFGHSIKDLYNNEMLDSVKIYETNNSIKEKGTGFLSGIINGSNEKNIVVEANNISLNLSYRKEVKDSLFVFENLEPGQYVFWAYEQKNNIDSLMYFSGTLDPYQRAAQFSILQDTIEVRKFWDIKGVNIEFKEDE